MQSEKKKCKWSCVIVVIIFVWFVMNVRVAAGIGTTFERAVDGLIGLAFLVSAVFIALDFFEVIGNGKE